MKSIAQHAVHAEGLYPARARPRQASSAQIQPLCKNQGSHKVFAQNSTFARAPAPRRKTQAASSALFLIQGRHITPQEDTCPPPPRNPKPPNPKLCCWSTKRRHITRHPETRNPPTLNCAANQQREDTCPETRNPPTLNCAAGQQREATLPPTQKPETPQP